MYDLYFIVYLFSLLCPIDNREYQNDNGDCIYICIDNHPKPCITGPYDDVRPMLANKELLNSICSNYDICYMEK